jgi:hypothetical protein
VVVRVHQQAGLAVHDRVERARHAAGHHRHAARVRLEVDDAEALAGEPARR